MAAARAMHIRHDTDQPQEARMLEVMKDLPPGVDGLKSVGWVSKDDYEKVLAPILEEAQRSGRHVRFLYEVGPDFKGFTPDVAWENVKLGLKFLKLVDACAVVSGDAWVRDVSRFVSILLPCPVRAFDMADRSAALSWLHSFDEFADATL